MELNKTSRWFYFLIGLWTLFILSLGAWWTHLYLKFSDFKTITDNADEFYRVTRMLRWEGITVFIGLLVLSALIFYIFIKDQRKTDSVRSFFATMTHEMKTPLASIKLQTEVLTDLLREDNQEHYQKIKPFADRLLQDGKRLETEMDDILQLARLESGADLELEEIDLRAVLEELSFEYPDFTFTLPPEKELLIYGNRYACQLIFRNLIENTKRHQPEVKTLSINIQWKENFLQVCYNDHGKSFSGDLNRLGKLFYKHNSDKGTGLGLYLIKKLMLAMKGQLEIRQIDNLLFNLYFPKKI